MRKILVKKDPESSVDAQWNVAIFLAISFAALLTLGVVAYLKFSPSVRDNQTVVSVRQPAQDFRARGEAKIQEKLPVQKGQMVMPASDAVKGTWSATFGDAGMVKITIAGDLFDLVLAQDVNVGLRRYSRGSYKYNAQDGKLELFPSQEYGEPKPMQGVFYKILTMRKFDIYLRQKQGDAALYFTAPEKDVLTKAVHPMFLSADYAGAPVLRFEPADDAPSQ